MQYQVGERVFAIESAKAGVCRAYGAGVYEGEFPYGDTTSTVPLDNDARAAHDADVLKSGGTLHNPRIRLDNGKFVWGCECWWGPEALVRKRFEQCQIVEVNIDVVRAESKGQGVPSMLTVDPPDAPGERS